MKKGDEEKVNLLKKTLYGLKQAPRVWYNRMDDRLLSLGFVKNLFESTLYVKYFEIDILIISLFVDDLLVTENNATLIDKFRLELKASEMIDFGLMTYIFKIEIKKSQDKMFIC